MQVTICCRGWLYCQNCRVVVLFDLRRRKKEPAMQILFGLYSWFFQACRYTSSQFTHKVMSSLVYPLPRHLILNFYRKGIDAYIAWIIICLKENLSRRCSLVVMYDGVKINKPSIIYKGVKGSKTVCSKLCIFPFHQNKLCCCSIQHT